MIKYTTTQVTFREFPDEVTLCINLSNCPHHCKGCHSPELREDIGNVLDLAELKKLISENPGITCVGLMGDTRDFSYINTLAYHIKKLGLKVGLYSGYDFIHDQLKVYLFDYIKVGRYIEKLGPLDNPNTNQKMYKITVEDITNKFWKNETV